MKNLFTLMLPVILLMTACEQNHYVVPNRTIVTDVNRWTTTDRGLSYVARISVPELDHYIMETGAVLVYISFNGGRTYEQVPEVYRGYSYRWEKAAGEISITCEDSDGITPFDPPSSVMTVKIVLIDSDY